MRQGKRLRIHEKSANAQKYIGFVQFRILNIRITVSCGPYSQRMIETVAGSAMVNGDVSDS